MRKEGREGRKEEERTKRRKADVMGEGKERRNRVLEKRLQKGKGEEEQKIKPRNRGKKRKGKKRKERGGDKLM